MLVCRSLLCNSNAINENSENLLPVHGNAVSIA
jgi:hypothetical protein